MSSSKTRKSHQLLERAKEVIPGGVFLGIISMR
ncbi:MAG: hypothetical protein Ct9H300mP20_18160 [Gammaproteobacteria bacterium]|nr:MAG: hypothetical protein Ct9H300mP20_18160 [Gammaproteobacteria bacterium]